MSELKYWIWLSQLTPVSPESAAGVIRHFGSPKLAFFAEGKEYDYVDGLRPESKQALSEKNLNPSYEIMDKCGRLGIRIITMQDTEYPERLRNIEHAPTVLYIKGNLPIMDEEAAIAVVGTRKASSYGKTNAEKLAFDITRGGGLIVSGLATGVDTAAARGGLGAGGFVVGVLGCGINVVYPRDNGQLYEEVSVSGALVSEYPPDTRPEGKHFPIRNRILSGLSAGVVVIEAPVRSGALITASRALDQGRELFVIPGNIDSPLCMGSNNLLKDGGAKAISHAEDVLCEFRGLYPQKLAARDFSKMEHTYKYEDFSGTNRGYKDDKRIARSSKKVVDKADNKEYIDLKEQLGRLSEDELAVVSHMTNSPLHVDDIIEAAGLPASRILAALTLLEIKGHVAQHTGKRFSLVIIKK